jgi:hypothetical protein
LTLNSGSGTCSIRYPSDARSRHHSRPANPCTEFTYDRLDRLTIAEYGIQDNNELFTIDDLGNRDNVNMRDGSDINYVIDDLTNRYDDDMAP